MATGDELRSWTACRGARPGMRRLVKGFFLVLGALTLLGTSACGSAPVTPSGSDVNQAASTLVALAFEAATRTAQARPPTVAPSATPTFEKPRLYVNSNVQCRSSTSANSKVIAALTAGMTLDMIGKDSADSAWLVQVPGGAAPCWVRAADSSPGGSFQSLPEVTPQPPSGHVPAAPTDLSWPFLCTYKDGVLYTIKTALSWDDTAGDANGFRVYRNDQMIADLGADARAYADTADVVLGSNLTYGVEAYNEAGASPRLVKTIPKVCTQ